MQPDGAQTLRFVDAIDDSLPETSTDRKPEMSATYRWRPAFQNDFAARLDWCLQGYEQANHAPHSVVSTSLAAELEDGALQIALHSGEWLELDASSSHDPDGDPLSFQWWVYPEAGNYRGSLEILGADQPTARIQAPTVSQPASLHLILTVSDSGQPPLCAYQRVILNLFP